MRRPGALQIVLLAACLVALSGVTAGSAASPRATPQVQRSGTGATLNDVACPGPNRCYVVGDGGIIRATVDAGVRWYGQRNPLTGTTARLVRIACPGIPTCYAVTPSGVVLTTTNGGARWQRHTVPLGSRGAIATDLACPGIRICYLTVSPNAIFLSVNGGATWASQQVPPTILCNGDCSVPMRYFLQWVSCPTASSCIAGGTHFVASNMGSLDAVVATNSIGGAWHSIWPHNGVESAVCLTVTLCYGLSDSSYALPGSDLQVILVSRDRNHLWFTHGTGTNRKLHDIACSGRRTCYAVGEAGVIVHTNDGSSFRRQSSPIKRNLLGVSCQPGGRCWAVGAGGTVITLRR